MRERSQTTPRRRGPKMPLPLALPQQSRMQSARDNYIRSESPYYTIDNTEDIYGTTLLPSQRCYVDPWDLENYDYVRKKINATPSMPTQGRSGGGGGGSTDYYEDTSSLSPSPAGEPVSSQYYYMPQPPPAHSRAAATSAAATMPRNRRRSHFQCELECCRPPAVVVRRRRYDNDGGLYANRGGARGAGRGDGGGSRYDDYMTHMMDNLLDEEDEGEQNIYTGYGGFSSSSSTERHSHSSSTGGGGGGCDDTVSTMMMLHTPGFGAATHKRRVVLPKPAPQLEFPAPPPLSPVAYDYCNPYATLPYCSVSDCYECLSQAAPTVAAADADESFIYAAPSLYGSSSYYGVSMAGGGGDSSSSTLGRPVGRRPTSSLYGGVYANKFGLSKKGLLQIDYSCSWNDLDRVIGRNY